MDILTSPLQQGTTSYHSSATTRTWTPTLCYLMMTSCKHHIHMLGGQGSRIITTDRGATLPRHSGHGLQHHHPDRMWNTFLLSTTRKRDSLVTTHTSLSLLRIGLNLTVIFKPSLILMGWRKYSMKTTHHNQDRMRRKSLTRWRLICTRCLSSSSSRRRRDCVLSSCTRTIGMHRLYTRNYVSTTLEKHHRWP